MGGLVAANLSGPSRLLYGTARDWVLGMRVALPSGERIHCGGKVIKNVSGYDMNKLFIGSLGTLGIITEVTFKLLPLPATRAAVVGLFPDLAHATDVVTRTLESVLLPEALDLLGCRGGGARGAAPRAGGPGRGLRSGRRAGGQPGDGRATGAGLLRALPRRGRPRDAPSGRTVGPGLGRDSQRLRIAAGSAGRAGPLQDRGPHQPDRRPVRLRRQRWGGDTGCLSR